MTVTRLFRVLAPLVAVMLASTVAVACGDDEDELDTLTPGDTASSTIPDEAGGGADEDPDDGRQAATCSADELREETFQRQELPTPVAETREAILQSAAECDFAELEEIALTGTEDFSYSFGVTDGNPAAYWRSLEQDEASADDVKPAEALVLLLNTAFGTIESPDGETFYVWPSAHAAASWDDVSEAEQQALVPPYTQADLDDFATGGAYLGWRIGIDADGEWRYFVAGD